MQIETMKVTPELAAQLLERNPVNRSVKVRHVRSMARDMAAGRWRLNGETVKIGTDGLLKDGQHRLAAVVESDATVEMAVAYDVDNDVQETVDTGIRRSLSDVLAMRGEIEAVALASVIRAVALHQMGEVHGRLNSQLSTPYLLGTLESHPELREGTRLARTHYQRSDVRVPVSVTGLAMWQFQRIDVEDCEFFFDRLCDGQDLLAGDPIHTLRRALTIAQQDRRGQALRTHVVHAYLIKSWNAYRDGVSLRLLKYRTGGKNREPFPEPR